MAGEDRTVEDPSWGQRIGSMSLDIAGDLMGHGADIMLKDAPAATRFVLKRIPEGPGFVYQAATLAAAKDKPRAVLGMIGGLAGGAGGGAVGALGGPVGIGVGSVLGSAAGEAGATRAYDAASQYYDAHKAQMEATRQWMADRTAQLFRH